MKKNKFNPGIKVTIFFVFFSCVFFSLGLWQIERGQDKQSILDQFENNTSKAPSVISDKSQKWDRVRVKGTWQKEKQIIIDCDVIEADGGTRTASVTGAWLSLKFCVEKMMRQGVINNSPIKKQIAAIFWMIRKKDKIYPF